MLLEFLIERSGDEPLSAARLLDLMKEADGSAAQGEEIE